VAQRPAGNRGVHIITRDGHDWTDCFPAIAQAAVTIGGETMILDGEAVILDETGRSDFGGRASEALF
jgi:bifunctional non-homologous end joining protein LigD